MQIIIFPCTYIFLNMCVYEIRMCVGVTDAFNALGHAKLIFVIDFGRFAIITI